MEKNKANANDKPKKPHKKIENIQDHFPSSPGAPRVTIESCRAKLKKVSAMLQKREEQKKKAK